MNADPFRKIECLLVMASLRRVLGHFYSAKKKLLCRPSRPVRIDIKTRQQQSRHPLAIRKERKKPLDEARTVLLCVCGSAFRWTDRRNRLGGGYLFTYLAEKGERKWGSQSNIRRRSRKSFARICSSISKEKSCQSPQRAHLNNEPTLFSS